MVFDYENAEQLKQLRLRKAELVKQKKQREEELDQLCPCHFVRKSDHYQEKKEAVDEVREQLAEVKQKIVDKENPHIDNQEYFSNRRSLKVPLRRRHPKLRL